MSESSLVTSPVAVSAGIAIAHALPHPSRPAHVAVLLSPLPQVHEADSAVVLDPWVAGALRSGVSQLSLLIEEDSSGPVLATVADWLAVRGAHWVKSGVCFELIGTGDGLARLAGIHQQLPQPAEHARLRVGIAAGYAGRTDVAHALQRWAKDHAAGRVHGPLNADELRQRLDSAAWPNVDLLLRTGGSRRLSSLLLWQAAYAELSFLAQPWTRCNTALWDEILADYARRQRKFGGLPG